MLKKIALASLALEVHAQAPGTLKTEQHPSLTFSQCTKASGCVAKNQQIVIDANWRWTHAAAKPTNCYSGNVWDPTLCPDEATCTSNCVVEGADAEYEGTYGIKSSGDTLQLGFVTTGSYSKNVGSRTYLMEDEDSYQMFKLKNKEFAFDVDVSQLPCGLNGALYFVQMDQDGGKSKYASNTAGAKYGTGYCDAQCPHDLKFIDGVANVVDWTPSKTDPSAGTGKYGSCCVEMDIWEANKMSTAYTAHSCAVQEQTRCSGTDCGDNPDHRFDGLCDKNGCDVQPFRLGNHSFFGPGPQFVVDSTKKMTVVTQFLTADGTDSGALKEIRRFYVQNGKMVGSPEIILGQSKYDSISEGFCKAEVGVFQDKTNFLEKGGLASMDDAFEKGMVLVMSLWDDHYADMLWLDSTYPVDGTAPGDKRGTCSTTSGNPKDLEEQVPNANVKFSNIRLGEIGSTTSSAPSPAPAPPSPSPAACPGGSLSSCISLCPSTPADAFKACVDTCVSRCSSAALLSAKPASPKAWAPCAKGSACPNGFECAQREHSAQCVPTSELFEAFVHTQPSSSAIQEFLRDGTTRFPPTGLAAYASAGVPKHSVSVEAA
ncbi:hypothetical protein AB1Y20_002303 [Prymnesium parvum]|uniref:cellulose 1,4-beta-cellobiosidase (non-reducing end) n=1 Tax=Prymnesium parvum TaxID=97485 RepID=A0AB34JAQ8_PRYPA